ncbi:polysaccharide lyase family 1 protein [Dendrothele bispora CBS 962.96]|uniref:Polysaccharide lyase family 1 protein n=1 Tax=Dendrothele bispora (strain CBS 962.96) TaxID=1314807 RepID=A0A4S8MWN5_DENBC|nr:polysaccharide lyase family 1 protein [Dendrothele bispora CBS 962.96]
MKISFLLTLGIGIPVFKALAIKPADPSFTPPTLSHQPFGYGGLSTGGSLNTSSESIFIVSNATELKDALALPFAKTIYVNGTINGNELPDGRLATCQDYIDMTGSPGADIRNFNFTQYLLSMNTTYTALIDQAIAQNVTFEGMNATEYKTLLSHMNGWRPVLANTMKSQVGFHLTNDTSVIGLDENAALNGGEFYVASVDNVWIRNMKLVSPQDCFPAPETFPSSWNSLYDAVGVVTATNLWVDSCELQDQLSGEYVQPDEILGWQVDRFDGLFDAEDGSDNITFSHNIVRNHHKSMLLGGGTKEAPRDLGKMHFTVFGNLFNGSASRSPTMRFGTFDVLANVYENVNDNNPIFDTNATLLPASTDSEIQSRADGDSDDDVPLDAVFEYILGVYNQSTVQIQDNVFMQTGSDPTDLSRIFTISESTLPEFPARVCVHESDFFSTMNGQPIDNLTVVMQDTIDHFVETGSMVEGAVVVTCEGIEIGYELPKKFGSAEEVVTYVMAEAGQH